MRVGNNFAFTFLLLWVGVTVSDAATLRGTLKIKRVRGMNKAVICLAPKQPMEVQLPPINPMMDQRKLEFIPNVLVIPVGSTVEFLNNDETKHNIFTPDSMADKFDFGYYSPGELRSFTFKKTGIASMLCNKHDEMEATVYVCDSHLFTKPEKKGEYVIEGIPPGDYTVKVWHKKKRKEHSQDFSVVDGENQLDFNLKR